MHLYLTLEANYMCLVGGVKPKTCFAAILNAYVIYVLRREKRPPRLYLVHVHVYVRNKLSSIYTHVLFLFLLDLTILLRMIIHSVS